MAEFNQSGPCGITANQLIDTGARLNGAFSEFAWANARQNSGCMPCPGKELPSWPPSTKDWGHTYPVQSKRGEQIIGSQMDACGEAPYNLNVSPEQRSRNNIPEIFEKFVATDIVRGTGPEAQEYDVALDIAEKILRGDSLSTNSYGPAAYGPAAYGPSDSKPYSYAQDLYGVAPESSYGSGKLYNDKPLVSNKRLENLLHETTDRRYGAAPYQHDNSEPLDDHSWSNVIPCVKNTVQGVSYDLQHWNNIKDEQCQGNKLYYVFARDDRWKYLCLIGISLLIFIMFIAGVASSMNSCTDESRQIRMTESSQIIPINSNGNPQRLEIIVKQV